jgi:plasmid stability protein
MAQLVVRNLEQSVKTKLQRRAKRHGRSMEEEVGKSYATLPSKRLQAQIPKV